MRVRTAEPGDAGAIGDVYLASRAAALPYLPRLHTDAETRAWIAGVLLPRCRVWVAEDAAGVAGFLALDGAWVEQLYLRPDALRRGIGTALLAEAQAVRTRLRLHVFQRNAAARAFYVARGFRLVAETDGSGNEEREPDAEYAWGAAAAAHPVGADPHGGPGAGEGRG